MTERSSTWIGKFAVAIRGTIWAMRTQSSCWVHLLVSVVVVAVAAFLHVELWRWAVLTLCIGVVLALELINTAIEVLVRALHPDHDEQVGRVLDVAAGAVLVAAIAAVAVGLITLGQPLLGLLTAA